MFKLPLTHLAIVAGLFAATACKDNGDSRKNAENAAEAVREKTADLKDNAGDLKETANDNADELADKTKDNAQALKEDLKDVAEDMADRAEDTHEKAKDNVEAMKDPTKDMTKDAIALRDAQKEFEYQRLVRVETLRTVHAIAGSQPNLIVVFGSALPMSDADRAKVTEKVQLVQLRLDESANMIQGLASVDAKNWEPRERAVSDAMNRLEDAREDAWEALDDVKVLDRTSMR